MLVFLAQDWFIPTGRPQRATQRSAPSSGRRLRRSVSIHDKREIPDVWLPMVPQSSMKHRFNQHLFERDPEYDPTVPGSKMYRLRDEFREPDPADLEDRMPWGAPTSGHRHLEHNRVAMEEQAGIMEEAQAQPDGPDAEVGEEIVSAMRERAEDFQATHPEPDEGPAEKVHAPRRRRS